MRSRSQHLGCVLGAISGRTRLLLFFGLFAAVAVNATLWLFALLVGGALADAVEMSAISRTLSRMLAVSVILMVTTTATYEFVVERAAASVERDLRAVLLRHLFALGPSNIAGARAGELLGSVIESVDAVGLLLSRYASQLVGALVAAIAVCVWLAQVHPMVSVTTAAAFTITLFAPQLWNRRLGERRLAHWAQYKRLNAEMIETLHGMPTLVGLGAVDRQRESVKQKSDELLRASASQRAISLVHYGLALFGSGLLLVSPVAMSLWIEAAATELRYVVCSCAMLAVAAHRLAGLWHASGAGSMAMKEVETILALVPPTGQARSVAPAPHGSLKVGFENVTFSYPASPTSVLRNASFAIDAGSTGLLVGRTGAGKTTIVRLLTRLLSPAAGVIRLGDSDVADQSTTEVRRSVAVVTQDPHVFAGSLADNVRLARPDADDETVRAALVDSNLGELIAERPEGIHAPVGERGLRLSGGQRQRLAIARALVLDAPVLVLDEATSSLDVENESEVIEALERVRCGRTTLVISHRPESWAAIADKTFHLADGRLDEAAGVAGPGS